MMTKAQFELEAVVNSLKSDRLESPKIYRVHCKPHKYTPSLFVYRFRIEMEKIIFGLLDKATNDKSSDMISYSERERFVEKSNFNSLSNMEESKKKLICISIMTLCLSWVVGVVSNSLSVGIMFACFCIAYLIYQSLNKEDGE